MRKILASLALCLLAQIARAQETPSPAALLAAQDDRLERLAHFKWERTWEAEEYDRRGNIVGRASGVWDCYFKDSGEVASARHVRHYFKHVRLSSKSLGLVGPFLPVLLLPGGKIKEAGMEGGLYLFDVGPPPGLFGFEGRVWVRRDGQIVKARGRGTPDSLLERGFRFPRVEIRFDEQGLPVSVVAVEGFGNGAVVVQAFGFRYHELRSDVTVIPGELVEP
jgi:hypothetical protein